MRSDGGPIHHCSKQFQIADNLLGCLKGHTCNWNYITQQVFWDKGFEESLALNCTIKRCSPFEIESTTRHVWNSGSALPILGVFDWQSLGGRQFFSHFVFEMATRSWASCLIWFTRVVALLWSPCVAVWGVHSKAPLSVFLDVLSWFSGRIWTGSASLEVLPWWVLWLRRWSPVGALLPVEVVGCLDAERARALFHVACCACCFCLEGGGDSGLWLLVSCWWLLCDRFLWPVMRLLLVWLGFVAGWKGVFFHMAFCVCGAGAPLPGFLSVLGFFWFPPLGPPLTR